MTAVVFVMDPEKYMGIRAAGARWSTVEQEFYVAQQCYELVLTCLLEGDHRQPEYTERQLICNNTWCSPFGAKTTVCCSTERDAKLSYGAVWVLLFFFFPLLFHAHFFNLNSSLMSSASPFSAHLWVFTYAHHLKDRPLRSREWVQVSHPFWRCRYIIRIKAEFHFKMFLLLLPQLASDFFFFTPSFRGGRPYFSVPVVSWFLFCICAGCSLKTRISMELLPRRFAFSYLIFSLLAVTAWICKSLFVLLTNISRNIWPVWFVTVLRESIFSYREVLPSFLAYTAERSITNSAMVHGCMCLLWKPPSSFNAF